MKYLVDANVLSEPTKPAPSPRVLEWLRAHESDWAELLARLRRAGKAMPIKDSLIAATAAVHGLAVVTRNRADFMNAGVRVVDPFAG